jgi:protein-S-isoprenylcysteine O-methyltransferase Ste14
MKDHILSFIWGPLLIAQILSVFFFGLVSQTRLNILVYAGYFIWVISAILGWWPVIYLKKKGGVAKGKSYVHTTALVKTGIYSIVRHPQYTAGILFSLALAFVSQHFVIAALGLIVMALLYIDIVNADKHEVEKFGEEYKRYKADVPRTNFVLGIIKHLKRIGKR